MVDAKQARLANPPPFRRPAAPIHRSTASRFSTRRLLEEVLAIRSAAVRSSAVGTEPRNQTVSRLTLTWMFLLFSPGAVCNFLTIRIFRSCEVSGSVDCSGSAPCVGFGTEVSGGNVGGVAPAGVLRGCCATAGSDSAAAITTTNLLLFFIIPLHLRQLEREERPSTTLLASIGVGFLDCLPLIHTSTDFEVGVVRDASKSSPLVVQPVCFSSIRRSNLPIDSRPILDPTVIGGGFGRWQNESFARQRSEPSLVTKGVAIESAYFYVFTLHRLSLSRSSRCSCPSELLFSEAPPASARSDLSYSDNCIWPTPRILPNSACVRLKPRISRIRRPIRSACICFKSSLLWIS